MTTPALTVEVDTGSASTRGRPPDRTWMVRLRRADRSIIVAIGLSRPAADSLAERIAELIDPDNPPQPPGQEVTPIA